jgi:hypothetical protein
MPIDDHHRRVSVAEQLIREGYANGAAALDQVVGFDHCTIGPPHYPSLARPKQGGRLTLDDTRDAR